MGGSGSGKSAASEIFKELGFKVVDADKVARKIMEKGQSAYDETVRAFGDGILLQDGAINRKKLGEVVFADPKKLGILDKITHKYIKKELCRIVSESNQDVLIDAALPPKEFCECDKAILITAPREQRIARIAARDGITREVAENRLDSQLSDKEYAAIADVIFDNDGSIEELKQKIKKWCINEKTD